MQENDPAPPGIPLAGFMTLNVLVGSSHGISRVALPLFAASLHAQSWQIGLVGGLQFGGLLLLSMPTGALIDRHGSLLLFRIGVLAAALIFAFGLTAASAPWQLILCVTGLALVIPLRLVTTNTEFLHLLPSLHPAKAGWNRAANTLGMYFIGPSLGALLIAALGYPSTFVMLAVAYLGMFVIGSRVLAKAPPGRGSEATPLVQRVRRQMQTVIARPMLRRTMLIDMIGQMALAYFSVFIVLLAMRHFGLGLQVAAGLVTLQGALFVATLFIGGALTVRWHDDRRYLVAITLLLGQALLLAFARSPAWLWGGAALLGVGLGLQQLSSVTRYGQLMKELGRGHGGGLSSMAGPAGGLSGSVLGGLLSQQWGLPAGFRVLVGLYLLLGWLQWRQVRAVARAAAQAGEAEPPRHDG
ncbi:MFS transporter [Aquabacterium sp.]|uniref:MFS transporter n=1 Tax=Aquabacterium sp. TaxID=1872578 RepID=UPI002B874B3D|nr:MFS transporter [Aquabacterium sp.]HSW07472.1 MFS transporter [Aquabacterium sp.]